MKNQVCPVCLKSGVTQRGSSKDVLIILEHPTEADVQFGTPFSLAPRKKNGKPAYTSAGDVIRTEMQRMGLDLNAMTSLCLWLHEPNNSEDCFNAGRDLVLDAAKGKRVVMLCGNLAVEYFTGYPVEDVNGLEMDSPYLSAKRILACVNPTHVFKNGLGEFRFGLQALYNILKEEGLA